MNSDYSTLHSLISSLRDDDCSWEEIADFLCSVLDDVHEEEELAEEKEDIPCSACGADASWDDLFNQIILPCACGADATSLTDEEISALSSSTLDFLREALSTIMVVRKIKEKKDSTSSACEEFLSLISSIARNLR